MRIKEFIAEEIKEEKRLLRQVCEKRKKYPENLIVVCSNGLLVRSKNEMAIAEMLIMYNIKFRYEMALELSKIKVDSIAMRRIITERILPLYE